ncbi:MAG: phytanoyl-CoA dioxygenase family protein [Armatimonadota bacterium]|nr:phytanoyl-CoA dioxygenase family protein [Armatimonadota bacterium]
MDLAPYQNLYKEDGYVVVKGLFSPDEVASYREHYMELRRKGEYPGDTSGVDAGSNDPLKQYPRMIHMHHWDETSLQWMLDKRLNECMTALLGREPYAVQTMLYFKPPKARGQALHQDNFYLRVQPGTCMAAWMALDRCDEENGCMKVVPGSHTWPVLCTTRADTTQSFTDVTVPIPEGQRVDSVIMEAGDVFFFNGSVVHGSYPNTSTNRFRRALIGHYIEGNAEQVAQFYGMAFRMDGTPVEIARSESGGSCGVWVEANGMPVIEMAEAELAVAGHE